MDYSRYRWLIDGHNVILTHADPAAPAAGPGSSLAALQAELESALAKFAADHRLTVCLVYDGVHRAPGRSGGRREEHLEVVFSDPPAEADDLICHRVERWKRDGGPEPLVITSDRRTLASRIPGTRVLGSRQFIRLLERDLDRPDAGAGPPTDAELERFFLSREEPEVPAATPPAPGPDRPPESPEPDPRELRAARKERGRQKQLRRLAWRRRRSRKR